MKRVSIINGRRQSTNANQEPTRGHLSRRDFLQSLLLTGLNLGGVRAIAPRSTLAQSDRPLTPTFYGWVTELHPAISAFNQTVPDLSSRIGQDNDTDQFAAEASKKSSSWDVYIGATPFVDLATLIQADVIEPWDRYIPEDVLNDIHPAIRAECSVDGKLYSWPFLLDIVVQGWNSAILREAGLIDGAPSTWIRYLASAKKVFDEGLVSYGCTFDPNGWRSLAPITHTYSSRVYYKLDHDPNPAQLFDFTMPAAIEALILMKQMLELAPANALSPTPGDGGAGRAAWATQAAAYYVVYHNALLRDSRTWPVPTDMHVGVLPKPPGGAGSTVFWTTGAVLFKYGRNKEKAAEYISALTHNAQIWQESIAGSATQHMGQLPPYRSLYKEWTKTQPGWMVDQPWVQVVIDQLDNARPIPNHPFGATQFQIGQPYWEKYLTGQEPDPMAAMQAAKDAVAAAVLKAG